MRYVGGDKFSRQKKLAKGDYTVVCDISGIPTPASETRMQWNGLRVREDFWTRRQPQDFIPAVTDNLSIPNARPVPKDDNSDALQLEDVLGDWGL